MPVGRNTENLTLEQMFGAPGGPPPTPGGGPLLPPGFPAAAPPPPNVPQNPNNPRNIFDRLGQAKDATIQAVRPQLDRLGRTKDKVIDVARIPTQILIRETIPWSEHKIPSYFLGTFARGVQTFFSVEAGNYWLWGIGGLVGAGMSARREINLIERERIARGETARELFEKYRENYRENKKRVIGAAIGGAALSTAGYLWGKDWIAAAGQNVIDLDALTSVREFTSDLWEHTDPFAKDQINGLKSLFLQAFQPYEEGKQRAYEALSPARHVVNWITKTH